MNAHTLMAKLAPFKGKELIASIDEINQIAKDYCYDVNVIDPEFSAGNIDQDSDRLNVRVDKNSVITSFTIG